MASEIKMLIYRQKKHTSKTKTALCHRDHARVCGLQAGSFVMPYIALHAVPRAHSDEDEIELTAETQTHAWTPLFADLYVSKGRSCC